MKILAEYPQWLAFRTVPRGTGKTDKIPLSCRTGRVCNAHDPASWVAFENVTDLGAGPAFALTEGDPFFCIDLDDCLDENGKPSAAAQEYLDMFPGAGVEVSVSGRGLHIWGTYTRELPAHVTRTASAPGVELYHARRFIALGGWLRGDAANDFTEALHTLIAERFAK